MTEKKYRITYNPYKRTTKVEEYYPGASNPWTFLGSEKEPELNHILAGKESIQQICMDLLSWIEEHNNQYSNCKEYEVIFYGIEQDFNEIKTIGEAFKKQHAGCRFMGIIQPEKFWDEPSKIQTAIEKICEDIRTIYVDEKELLEKIEACLDVIDQNLNILVLGMQNSGKSTLINALLGREILPTSEGVETATLYTIEPGSTDQILIYLSSGKCMEISIEDNRFKYNAIGCEVDQIVGNISESKAIKKAKSSSEIIQVILKELNTVCRKMQNSQKILFIKEIKIQLKDFEILGKKQTVCIKDFPGAGAKYLGEEHKAIIQEEIENITNAVAINVLNVGDSTLKTVYDFIGNVRGSGQVSAALEPVCEVGNCQSSHIVVPDLDDLLPVRRPRLIIRALEHRRSTCAGNGQPASRVQRPADAAALDRAAGNRCIRRKCRNAQGEHHAEGEQKCYDFSQLHSLTLHDGGDREDHSCRVDVGDGFACRYLCAVADSKRLFRRNCGKCVFCQHQSACAFCAATVDGQRDAVFACTERIIAADLKYTGLHVHLRHFNTSSLACVRDDSIVGADRIAVHQ